MSSATMAIMESAAQPARESARAHAGVPVVDAKGFAADRPWTEVENALVRNLRAQAASGEEPGVTLSFLPFSDLGGAPGDPAARDHSWEVLWGVATVVNVTYNGEPTTAPSWDIRYATAGHPAEALDEATWQIAPQGVTLTDGDKKLVEQWRGWSAPLRDLAVRATHMPREEAGIDVSVSVDKSRPTGWQWQIEIPVVNPTADPMSSWEADTFADLLDPVLAQEAHWLLGLPAGHLLDDALRDKDGDETRL